VKALGDLRTAGGLEKQFDGLAQVLAGRLDGFSLAGNVQFRTEGDVKIPLFMNRRRKRSL